MTEAPRTTAPETALPGTASTGTDVAANWPDLLMTLMHGQDLTEEQASWAM
ncbi:anthranilate phosphoribosyltransferase, partial [Burkholderia multivorans]